MSQDFETATSRLNNLRAIEPLINALRTMSMGTWQKTQKKAAGIRQLKNHYRQIINQILPHLDVIPTRGPQTSLKKHGDSDGIVLIIGSERGLCGKFNETLAKNALEWINAQGFSSVQIWAVGKRMIQTLEKRDIDLSWRKANPGIEKFSYTQAYLLIQDWLEQYEKEAFDHFMILYNQPGNGKRYELSVVRLLPYEISQSVLASDDERWPTPIIETDPKGIFHQILQQYIASSFYQALLLSTAAEHASRYYLLEDAQQNADEIIQELKRIIHTERKRKITQQVQELAVGAGLLDNN